MINLNDNSKVIHFSYLDKDFDDRGLYLPVGFKDLRDNIICVEDKYYHIKMSNKWILNELIGSFLSKKIGLEAVDYKIGLCYEDKYALSEVFFKKGYSYCSPTDMGFYLSLNADRTLSQEEDLLSSLDRDVVEKILKLSFLDIRMGQFDRDNPSNIMIKYNKNGLDLAPVYDFDSSYEYEAASECYNPHFYGNQFIVVKKNKKSLSNLIKRYPFIYDSVEILRDISIDEILYSIESLHGIEIPGNVKGEYEELDKGYKKIFKRL